MNKKNIKKFVPFAVAAAAGALLASLVPRYRYQGKRVLITGGSRGFGLSLAWNLLKKGAVVTLLARDGKELRDGRSKILKDFPEGTVHTITCDVTDHLELEKSIARAVELMGGMDILINNAGSILVGPFESMEIEDFRAQMELHLFAVIRATQLVLPHFKERKEGRILNVCSMGGKVGVPHMIPYDASKFALAGFSQGVTSEFAPLGIRVTTMYPTVMRTGSPIQAVFKGNTEEEFRWFQTLDLLPGVSMSADTAAKKALNALARGQREVILSTPAKLRMVLGAIAPEMTSGLMSAGATVLPKGKSKALKTGAQSSALFDKSRLLRSLREKARKEQKTYNQRPRHSAEFNLGRDQSPHKT